MKTNQTIRIAQIGVGYWGPNLLRNLVANNNCSVKRVVDLSKDRRAFVKNLYPSIQISDQVEDIFEDSEIDAVVIATPIRDHFELSKRSLSSGKHVLVEKPMATTVDQIDEIEDIASEKNLIAMAGYTFLYNSAVRYVKELIDSEELGEIRYVYSQRLNLGRIRSDVDSLWNFAPHDISIIQYWLDNLKPVLVTKQGMDYIQPGIDDVVFLNIVYPNRVVANVHVSWLDPLKVRRMIVVGSEKMVVYDDTKEYKIAMYDKGIDKMAVLGENMDFDSPDNYEFNYRSGNIMIPKITFHEPVKLEIEHFIDCIREAVPCITGTKLAREVVRIISTSKSHPIE